jgi:hypothetical protein
MTLALKEVSDTGSIPQFSFASKVSEQTVRLALKASSMGSVRVCGNDFLLSTGRV